MRKVYFLVIVSMMFMVTGCDFFRQLAGRPTSADIQVRRQEVQADIEAKAAQEKARQDSLAAILKNEKDSTEACVYIEANKIRVCLASELRGIAEDGLTDLTNGTMYRVILGSFRSSENADKIEPEVIRKEKPAVQIKPKSKGLTYMEKKELGY